jgi:hypothetical protein
MGENTFLVLRIIEPDREPERGRFIVMPWSSSERPSQPPWGLIPPGQTLRGTEAEIRQYLADKGQPRAEIQRLVELANNADEVIAPEYIVG